MTSYFRGQRPITAQERYNQLEDRIKSRDNYAVLCGLVSKEMKVAKISKVVADRLSEFLIDLKMTRYLNYESIKAANEDICANFVKSLSMTPAQEVEANVGSMFNEFTRVLNTDDNDRGTTYYRQNKTFVDGFEDTNSGAGMGLAKNAVANLSPYDFSYAMRSGYTMNETIVVLDSRYRDPATDLNTHIYAWGYTSTDFSDRVGVFNSDQEIVNIIGMKIQPFFIPNVPNANNIYNSITLHFSTLPNSAIAREGRRFHFMFNTDKTDPNFIKVTPLQSEFRFNNTIKSMPSMQLSFASPLQKFNFGVDSFMATAADLNPMEITSTNHGLLDGNLVFIFGYTTTTPSVDLTFINSVNSDRGYYITYKDANTFSIQLDATAVTSSGIFKVFNGNKRFIVPITFMHLKESHNLDH